MNPLYASAVTLSQAIRKRDISAEELTRAHLERILDINPKLNAVVQLRAEEAIKDAQEADRALARSEPLGTLHGVPFTVKDWLETHDLICAAGEEARRHYIPPEDATVVKRLRAAGGILLGKTNAVSGNPIYGLTNNPYHLDRTPAGSSSGEAALIAAGGSPLGLGSDSGGSIRQPAHVCGIAGLKPTTGRVPLTGHYPVITPMLDPRTVIGPLARTVDDLALGLELIAGADPFDASVIPMPLGDYHKVRLEPLRIAFYSAHEGVTPTPETVQTVENVARVLEESCALVTHDSPERLEETYSLSQRYWQRPESASLEQWLPDGEAQLTSLEVEQHLFEWERFRRALWRFMERYDVIITPAAVSPAVAHNAPDGGIPYTLTYSLTGYPCVVVRAGTSLEGLPIGVQVVARPWREDVALAVAKHIETVLGGWQKPPL